MAENSSIEWTTHTFNPWIGCTKVSAACDNCYAEEWNNRFDGGANWGPHAPRRRTKTWGNPVKWNKQAEGASARPRVFCASLADFADNHKSIQPEWRQDLIDLIDQTPNLDWLMLTKRPQNVMRLYEWRNRPIPDNIWIGTTVEDQKTANQRIPHLLGIPARVRFLSCEPLLGPVDLEYPKGIWPDGPPHCCSGYDCGCKGMPTEPPLIYDLNWIITGGESGNNHRPDNADWYRSLRDQCAAAGVPFLFKQWGGKSQKVIKKIGRELDGVIHDGYPV